MRYGIIGAGAIGGYYGAKLAHAGQEVHFLLRSDYEQPFDCKYTNYFDLCTILAHKFNISFF